MALKAFQLQKGYVKPKAGRARLYKKMAARKARRVAAEQLPDFKYKGYVW